MAPLAEYREWPFQGFLKRTTIGNQTIYNLEFELPCIPEHLDLSLHPAVLSASSRGSSAEAVVSPGRHVSQAGQGTDQESRESVDQDGPRRQDLGRDRTAIPRLCTAVIEGELLHEARGNASKAGSKAWCEG